MNLKSIFESFSRRDLRAWSVQGPKASPAALSYDVPDTTRNRILMWCDELYSGAGTMGAGDYRGEFWDEIHRALRFRQGMPQLSGGRTPHEDAISFLLVCSGPEFLDFIEDIFKVEIFWRYSHDARRLVGEVNDLLRIDDVPVALTEYVTEQAPAPSPFGGTGTVMATSVREYPRIIDRGSDPTYSELTTHVLTLLARVEFSTANKEYLTSLEDLRKGDYGDCLTKCCSAFESTMQVICDIKCWPYNESDTANVLIKTIVANTGLEPFFETTLQLAATLRNRLSSSHGGGASPRNVPRHVAAYATQLVGASILLLVAAAGL